jgi:DNA-binding CsgD family transcriptional regulator
VDDNALVDRVIRALAADARRQASEASQATVATRIAQLTPREHEVMRLVLAGKFNKVIADELNISMRTVEVHRSRVFEKMGVRSAVELAQLLAQPRTERQAAAAPRSTGQHRPVRHHPDSPGGSGTPPPHRPRRSTPAGHPPTTAAGRPAARAARRPPAAGS